MTDSRLEALAAIEHEQWISWAQQILLHHNIPPRTANRWRKLFVAYDDLPEDMKGVSRGWASRTLGTMAELGMGFRFEIGQEVNIRDAKIQARVRSRIEEANQRLYRVMFWNQGQQQIELVAEGDLDPC